MIPTRDGCDLLRILLPILDSMLVGKTAEIIVVDNGSGDGTAAYLAAEHPHARVDSKSRSFGVCRRGKSRNRTGSIFARLAAEQRHAAP